MNTALQCAVLRADMLSLNEHPIPPITDEMGKYWYQPARKLIEVDATHALMAWSTFERLKEYSGTAPSGVYTGKMWRRHNGVFDREFVARGGQPEWLLCWYGPCADPKHPGCKEYRSTYTRKIIILDDKRVEGHHAPGCRCRWCVDGCQCENCLVRGSGILLEQL